MFPFLRSGGLILLNPPMDTVLGPLDKVIVIAEDNDTYWPLEAEAVPQVDKPYALSVTQDYYFAPREHPVKVLLVGWRRDMDYMIEQVGWFCLLGVALG